MSLYKDASLAMIPSAYKDGKLYSIRPTDGSGDFTFSRGSNLAATRVDVNGLIEKGRENLLLQSNQFDTTWARNMSNITSGQSGYDGSSDAWKLEENSLGNYHSVYQTTLNTGVSVLSVYAKTAGRDLQLRVNGIGLGRAFVNYDLSAGTIGLSGGSSLIDSSIESVGNGWYRCSFALSDSGTYGLDILTITDASTSTELQQYIGDGTSGVFIQDAQLEQGLVATDYIETGTSAAQSGILEDMPRLDYSGGASCPSLLLESQRTNVVTNSEYLEGGFGLADFVSVSLENVTAPDGSNLVTKVQANGDDAGRAQDNLGTRGANHIYSGFFKGTGVATRLRFRNNQGSQVQYDIDASGNFTLNFEDAANDNYDIEDYGNGWYRIWFETATSAVSSNYVQIYPDNLDGNGSVYAWGIQAEEGSYPTSYIPTYGSSVTRSYDTLNDLNLDGLFSGNSYTILFDIDLNDTFNNKVFAEAKKSTNSSSFTFRNFNGLLRVYNNLDSTYLTGSIASDSSKWVVRIDGSTADVFSYNSGSPSKTSGTPLATIRDFGKINFSGGPTISSLNQFLIFPTALSDAECNSLVQ